MFSSSDSESDDDASSNLLQQQSPQQRSKTLLPLPSRHPPLAHQATEKVQQSQKNLHEGNNNNSPSFSTTATATGGEQDVSPATQTINQLSQTNQSTSLHYDLSQLEHDVATTLGVPSSSKQQQRSSPEQQQQQQQPKSSIAKTNTTAITIAKLPSSSSRGKILSENAPKNNNNKSTAALLLSSTTTTNRPQQAVEQQFLEIGNFCLYQIDISEAGPLGLTITRHKPSEDLVESLQQHATTTQEGIDNNNNMDTDDDDDDATVDETRVAAAAKKKAAPPLTTEGLENACYVDVVRGSSLAECCGIKAGDWFVQNIVQGESNADEKNKKIWFLFYDDVRTLAKENERPIQFILARRKPPVKKSLAATAKKAASAKPSVSFQQDDQSSTSNTKATAMERQRQESNTGRPQHQEVRPSVGLLKEKEKDAPNASGASDKPLVQSQAQKQTAPSSKSNTSDSTKSGTTTSATTNTKTATSKSSTAGSKKPASTKKQAPASKPAAKGSKSSDDGMRADDYVPFCIKCNNTSNNKNDSKNKKRSHHAWCPKHPQVHNSGADVILERLRTGIRLGCPLCTKEFQSGRLDKSGSGGAIKHTKSCLKNQQRLKSSSHATAKKQDSLVKKPKKATYSLSAKGKRKNNNRTGQSTLQPRKRRKNEHIALDTSSSSSSSSSEDEEPQQSRIRKGRKTSSAKTKRRARSSTRRRADDFSDDSDDESMYMDDDSDGKRRPMQTLLALKTNKRSRKDTRATERSHQITPNETTRTGHAQPQRGISTQHGNVEDNNNEFDNDSVLDENEPPSTAWEADDNPWGPALGYTDGDVIIYAPQTDMVHYDAMLPSNRYQSDPFSANSQYYKTHQTPSEGFQVLVLKRDVMTMSSWGFSCYRHEFGGACLVKHVDPLSPADTCSFAGSSSDGGTGSGLRPNDMIIAVNGKLVGGMSEVALDVEFETAMCEVLLVIARYKFAQQGLDKIAEAEQSYLAAVDDAMNDEHLLGWTDIGNRQTAASSRESHSVPLPKADIRQEATEDGNGHATTNKDTEPPAKNVGMIDPVAPGRGGGTGAQEESSANAKASLDKPSSTSETESHQSGATTLPRTDSHMASALDRNQHCTTSEGSAVEQSAQNDYDKIPPGAGHGDTGAPNKSSDGGAASDELPSGGVEKGTTLRRRLQEGSSVGDSTESKEYPAANARNDSQHKMCNINSESHGGSSPAHHGSGRSSEDHPVVDNSAPAAKDPLVEQPESESALMQQLEEEEQSESFDANNADTDMGSGEASGQEDDNPDEEEEDDGNAWCGCVCGEVHKSNVPVYWIQCGACMTWYNVSRTCVGFDREHASSLEHWECWACNDLDESEVDSNNEQDTGQNQWNSDKALEPPVVDHEQQTHDRDSESVTENRTNKESTTRPSTASKSSSDQQMLTVFDTAGNSISSDRFGPDGCIYPERTLRTNTNGTYARPHERRPADYCWDEIRGVWVPQNESSLSKHNGTNSKDLPKDGSAVTKKRSSGKNIPDDRWTTDGCILPKSAPVQRADGTFACPTGRIADGFAWNEQRGVYAPKKKENRTVVGRPQSQSQRSQGSQLSRPLRPGRSRRSQESTTLSSAGTNDQARGIIDSNSKTNNNNSEEDEEVFVKGDHVFIKEHAWPGVNNPEGIAVVLDSYIDEDGDRLYDVKYIIGRSKSLGILARFVSRHEF